MAVASRDETLGDGGVIQSKNDLVTIVFNVSDAIRYSDRYVAERANTRGERALADGLRSEVGVHSTYHSEDFPWVQRSRLPFCLAALLEEGSFIVTLNDTGDCDSLGVHVVHYSGWNDAMDELDSVQINRKAFSIAALLEPSDEKAYWLSKTPYERLQAAELMRQIVCGYDPSTTRLQRVLEIAQRSQG